MYLSKTSVDEDSFHFGLLLINDLHDNVEKLSSL